MPNDIEHERHRFRTMNVRQLRTRLNKITDSQKLRNFIQVCDEYNGMSNWSDYMSLRAEADRKLSHGRIIFGMDVSGSTDRTVIRTTSTNPPEAHQEYVSVIVLCENCKKRVPPKNCNVPVYHLGLVVYFCSEKCKTVSAKVWEIEKRKEGIRVIKVKKRR